MSATTSECALKDVGGETVAVGSRDQITRLMKHQVGDGVYAVAGPGIDMAYYRIAGVVYPCGGTQDGVSLPRRSREECRRFFGEQV